MSLLGLIFFILSSAYFFCVDEVEAHPFTGSTGVVSGRIIDVSKNPANLAHIKYGHLTLFFDVYRRSTFNSKFEGLEPVQKESQGFFNINPGNFASDVNFPFIFGSASETLGFAFSIFPIPPMNLTWLASRSEINEIPIYLFRQTERVSLKINNLKVKGGILSTIAFRFKHFSMGFSGRYFAADLGLDATLQDTDEKVFSLDTRAALSYLSMGIRVNVIPGWLSLGFSTPLLNSTTAESNLEAGLLSTNLDVTNNQVSFFNLVSFGAKLKIYRLNILTDLHYTKAEPERGINLSQLKVGDREVYDTLAPSIGFDYRATNRLNLMGGFRFVPARYGDGSSEDGGKVGFGSLDITQIYIGANNLTPYYEYSSGIEYRIWRNTSQSHSKEKRDQPQFKMILSMGAILGNASRGVDQNGSEPATYAEQNISFPIGLTYFY